MAEKKFEVVLLARDETAAGYRSALRQQQEYVRETKAATIKLQPSDSPALGSAAVAARQRRLGADLGLSGVAGDVAYQQGLIRSQQRAEAARQAAIAADERAFREWRANARGLREYVASQRDYVGGSASGSASGAASLSDVYMQSAMRIGMVMAAMRGVEAASKAATAAMRRDWEGLDTSLGQIPFFGQGWQAGRALKQSFIDLNDAAKKYMYPWLRGIPTELQRLEGQIAATAKATARGAETLANIRGLKDMSSEMDKEARLRGKKDYELQREQVLIREEERLANLRAMIAADSRTMSESDAEELRIKILKQSAEELNLINREELDAYTKQRNAEREVARRVQAANREEWERGKQAAREYGSQLLSIENQTRAKRLENAGKANEAKLVLMRDAQRRELEQAKSARERELLQARFGEEERALMLAGRGRGMGGRPAPVNAAVLSGRFWDSNVGTAMDPTVSAMREAASEAKETRKAVQKLPAEMVRALSMLLGQDVTFTLGMVN